MQSKILINLSDIGKYMINKRDNFFGKNVLITGINGFIGGNLASQLLNKGANVYGIMRDTKKDTLLFYEELDKKVVLIHGDILDKDFFSRIIAEEQIQSIFHLAAQVEVGVGLTNPYVTFETNIKGTYSLLEGVRQCPHSIESIIIASTDKSYGSYPREKMPYKEDYPLIPKYPYDVSKACADMVAQSYATEVFELPVVITRFCNIFGPGQLNFSAIFPDSIRACLGYGDFVPRGNGEQIRDFIFIDDVIDLYLRIGEKLSCNPSKYRGNVYNAGTNTPISVRDVLQAVYRLTDNEDNFNAVLDVMKNKKTIGEIDCQFMDYEKVNEHFGWAPKYSFEDGVVKTIEWFKNYLQYKYGE